jgi:molecular chaperone DnaK (HSP70)
MNEERIGKCLRQVEYIRGHRTCTLIISLFFSKGKTTISRNLILEDANGHTMNAMKVFSESIKYLKDHFVETIESRITDLVETDIHWVLTVPAIWKDNAKQCMREAAQQVFCYLS